MKCQSWTLQRPGQEISKELRKVTRNAEFKKDEDTKMQMS